MDKPAASHVLGAARAVRLELSWAPAKVGVQVGSSRQGEQEPGPEAGTLGASPHQGEGEEGTHGSQQRADTPNL